MKKNVKLSSFYYGFPVFLVTTTDNSNGDINVASISSSISLGDKIIIGVSKGSKTYDNLLSGSDVVINIPDYKLWEKVEALGKLTGSDTLSEGQIKWGVQICQDKFSKVGLHTEPSTGITPPRVIECPIQAECKTVSTTDKGRFILVELDIVNVWVDSELLGSNDVIDSSKWKPLIYNFREYDTTGDALGFNFKYGH
ncbi:flavin reductase family protein [Pectobacterium parmentieri]|uniref:Flavin reductase family protein n=2 Tax=Pectobacterium TaxID=122277 RepID=A0A0H3IAY6_PECPM|nr:flavin reductase family protein [Pectobacterium parmentieri]ACX88732.1 flavin reductase domain protein FMN-binding protein [Pectobacterium parmentieri WPP163]AFI91053.1 Flavoredoxin [Pectobacterium parmentieri]AYH06408.1 flavin reductase family protein [Pectobacterium parmentieri]AYH23926.1 flavin reductase family protein [Pectobacterium parmentieri]MBI0470338.1 flavin reductase family protein [Pectobacterium parmentieri]